MERMRRLAACYSFFVWLSLSWIALAADPLPQKIGELSFLVPAEWKVEQAENSAATGVIFSGRGPQGIQLTIARLPVGSVSPALPLGALNPMIAPETLETRVYLQEVGLTPLNGVGGTVQEGSAQVTQLSFDCKTAGPLNLVVLTCTWRTSTEVLRARLQVPAGLNAETGAEVDAVRASFRFAGRGTIGFGNFRLAQAPPLPNAEAWARLTPAAASVAVATLPPPTAESPAAGSTNGAGSMVQQYRGSLVIVEGGQGAGSGFVCQMQDGLYLLTNQHVACEMPVLRLVSVDGAAVPVGTIGAAVGHDIIRFSTTSAARPLTASTNVDGDAKIGDEIIVLGNSEGARVVQPLTGTLVGIGPDRIEVSAEFVPGNSGSPIIHVRSGKVIGIATYLMQRGFSEFRGGGGGGAASEVRRFGYRLDSVRQWQPVAWPTYRADQQLYAPVEELTKDLARLIGELSKRERLQPAGYSTSVLFRPVRDYAAMMSRRNVSGADRSAAVQTFLASLRNATVGDLQQVRPALRYDYFQRELNDQAQIREQMFKLFDRLLRGR